MTLNSHTHKLAYILEIFDMLIKFFQQTKARRLPSPSATEPKRDTVTAAEKNREAL